MLGYFNCGERPASPNSSPSSWYATSTELVALRAEMNVEVRKLKDQLLQLSLQRTQVAPSPESSSPLAHDEEKAPWKVENSGLNTQVRLLQGEFAALSDQMKGVENTTEFLQEDINQRFERTQEQIAALRDDLTKRVERDCVHAPQGVERDCIRAPKVPSAEDTGSARLATATPKSKPMSEQEKVLLFHKAWKEGVERFSVLDVPQANGTAELDRISKALDRQRIIEERMKKESKELMGRCDIAIAEQSREARRVSEQLKGEVQTALKAQQLAIQQRMDDIESTTSRLEAEMKAEVMSAVEAVDAKSEGRSEEVVTKMIEMKGLVEQQRVDCATLLEGVSARATEAEGVTAQQALELKALAREVVAVAERVGGMHVTFDEIEDEFNKWQASGGGDLASATVAPTTPRKKKFEVISTQIAKLQRQSESREK